MDINNSFLASTNSILSPVPAPPPKRVRFESDDWIDKIPRIRLLERWKEQDNYIDYLELRLNQLQQSIDSNERLREKEAECKKLKSMLNYRFLTKTTQQQSLDQMRDMMQPPSLARLRQTYLDPSINLIFGQMRDELDQSRKAREEAQNELQAWQFTSDSKTGKMLMARCKKLLEENEQLGKMVSSDKVANLEGEIALQNRLLSDMKDSQRDYEDIMIDMDANMDTLSGTLLHMRRQLTESHQQITLLNEENIRLRTLSDVGNNKTNDLTTTTTTTTADSTSTTMDSTPNGTSHTNVSTGMLSTNNNKFAQKRPHPSNRTTPNVANKLKTTTNLYDVDEITTPPLSQPSNELMDVDQPILLTNSSSNTSNQHQKRTEPLENGIVNVIP